MYSSTFSGVSAGLSLSKPRPTGLLISTRAEMRMSTSDHRPADFATGGNADEYIRPPPSSISIFRSQM